MPGLTVPAQYWHALHDWTLMARVKTGTGGGKYLSRRLGVGLNYELGLNDMVPYAKAVSADGAQELLATEPAAQLKQSVWTHLAATYNSATATLTLYVDGMPVAQAVAEDGDFEMPLFADDAKLLIGQNCQGRADDLRIYSEALSQEEIFAQVRAVESGDYAAALPFGIETALDAALEQSRIALLAAQNNLMNADNLVNSRWNSLQAAAEALETANAGNDANAKTEAQATYDAAQINYNNAVSNRNLAQQELNAAQAAYDSAAAAASRSGNLVSVWRGSGLGSEGSDRYLRAQR